MGRGDTDTEARENLPTVLAESSTKDRLARASEDLADTLSAIQSSADWQAALRSSGRFLRQYSFKNAHLILSQLPTATRVAGFGAWRALGNPVRKGEKALVISAPIFHKEKVIDASSGQERTEQRLVNFRPSSVFDVSQTENPDLPPPPKVELPQGDGGVEQYLRDTLLALLRERGRTLHSYFASACSSSKSALNFDASSVGEAAEEARALAHTLAHIQIKHTREGDAGFTSLQESEAESTAYLLLDTQGVDPGTYSFGQIALWSKGDIKTLRKAGAAAMKAAGVLSDEVENASRGSI